MSDSCTICGIAFEGKTCPLCEAQARIAELEGELRALRLDSISLDAHETCCNEAARQAASCNMDHHAEARKAEAEVERLRAGFLDRTPDGTGICYLHDGQLILIGQPPDEDESEECAHNCDDMGCSSVSHVIERHQLTAEQVNRLAAGERVGVSEIAAAADTQPSESEKSDE